MSDDKGASFLFKANPHAPVLLADRATDTDWFRHARRRHTVLSAPGLHDDDAEAITAPEAVWLKAAAIGAAGLLLAAGKAAAAQHPADRRAGIEPA